MGAMAPENVFGALPRSIVWSTSRLTNVGPSNSSPAKSAPPMTLPVFDPDPPMMSAMKM